AEPHRVTRLVAWQKRLTRFDRANHLFLRLADADAADGIAVEIKIDNRLRASLTQFVKRRALDDSESKLAHCSCRRLSGRIFGTAAGDIGSYNISCALRVEPEAKRVFLNPFFASLRPACRHFRTFCS